jgi:hypothetical protein
MCLHIRRRKFLLIVIKLYQFISAQKYTHILYLMSSNLQKYERCVGMKKI